jgi:hypothetical protein
MKPKPVSKTIAAFVLAASLSNASHAADKSRYSLLDPTPDALQRDMSTDRPDKTESPYTVDAGHLQIETDLVAYTHDRQDGVTTRTLDVAPFNLKAGLTNDTDLQLVYGAFSRISTSGRRTETDSGTGDLLVRLKHNIWGNDGGTTAFAVMPFVKLPTNTLADLNDDVEGGVIVPLAIDIGHGMGLGLMTEIDILKSETGSGYEPAYINSATVSFELTSRLGLYVEAFVERRVESGAETIVTIDGGFTYAVTENLQLDAGANIGATRAADDLNIFAGLSRRY